MKLVVCEYVLIDLIGLWCLSTDSVAGAEVLGDRASASNAIHLPLSRRGGRFAVHDFANTTRLSRILSRFEASYTRSFMQAGGNKIVRRWQPGPDGEDDYLLEGAGLDGGWYTTLQVGEPPQMIEVDIDMLSPEFYMVMTTNEQGSKYDTFSSTAHKPSSNYAHPLCRTPTDLFHFPLSSSQTSSAHMTFPLCQAPKYSSYTLHNSGTILGLAPSGSLSSLSRLNTPTLLEQLHSASLIPYNIFSLTLLTSTTGMLSLGSSIAPQIEETKIRAEKELSYLGETNSDMYRVKMELEIEGAMAFAMPPGSTHEHHFKWTDSGAGAAAGWHMALATGLWVGGVKVLRNQPVLFDVGCPFVIAPRGAAASVYESIPGARRLSDITGRNLVQAEGNEFWAFPCLNEVDIAFEIAGWRFPLAKGEVREDAMHGPVGGRFSLGKVDLRGNSSDEEAVGTGYCVGIIVESDMGLRPEAQRSAMRNVWVLGEPFFRRLGVAFDMGDENGKGGRIGLRVY